MLSIDVITPSIRPKYLSLTQQTLEEQTYQNFQWHVEIGLPNKNGHDLNKAYNRLLRRCTGDVVVFLQDAISIPSDALQRLSEISEFVTCPVGKVKEWSDDPKYDWRENTEKADWRKWEIDFGAAPLEALKQTGGFDEEMDGIWSGDNLLVGYRAHKLGYTFRCLPDIKAVAVDHDAHEEHPFRRFYYPEEYQKRMNEYDKGLVLDYI